MNDPEFIFIGDVIGQETIEELGNTVTAFVQRIYEFLIKFITGYISDLF